MRDPRRGGLVSRKFRAGAREVSGSRVPVTPCTGSGVGCWLVRWKAGQGTDLRLRESAGIRITLTRDNHPTQEPRREQALTSARLLIIHS